MNEELSSVNSLRLKQLASNQLSIEVIVELSNGLSVEGKLWRRAFGSEARFCVTSLQNWVLQNRCVSNFANIAEQVLMRSEARELLSAFQPQMSEAFSRLNVE